MVLCLLIKNLKRWWCQVRIIAYKEIYALQKNPVPISKKHIIDVNKNKILCELSVDKLRFYYIITEGRILINDVEFFEKIEIEKAFSNHKSDNKQNNPNQRRDIGVLKKWFLSKFRRK